MRVCHSHKLHQSQLTKTVGPKDHVDKVAIEEICNYIL